MKPWCFIRDAEGYCEGSFNLHSRNFKVPNTYAYPFLTKNRLFFSGLAYSPNVRCQWKRSPKTHLLKNALQGVENAVLLYPCHCGLMKTKVFENDDVTGSDTSKCACSHQVWYRLQSLLLFRVGGLKCNVWTPIFFEKGDKTDTCGRDLSGKPFLQLC